MPLPKQEINWLARVVVLVVFLATTGSALPLLWLLAAVHAPVLVVPIFVIIWLMLVLCAALWAICVWFPVSGPKITNFVLKSIQWF